MLETMLQPNSSLCIRGYTAAVHTRAKAAHIGLFDAAAADQQPITLGF